MKTFHSLASRGRIRVFFKDPNAAEGAPEVEDGGKYPIFTDTRKALAGVILATALVLGNNGNAQAQTAGNTVVAANSTIAPTPTDRTSTGILFSYLVDHPEAVRKLSRADKEAFYDWQEREDNKEIATQQQAAIERGKQEYELDRAAITRKDQELTFDQRAIEQARREWPPVIDSLATMKPDALRAALSRNPDSYRRTFLYALENGIGNPEHVRRFLDILKPAL